MGSLAGFFLLLVVVVYAVQKEQGGTFGNGISRATHFIVYVIVMLQTTLYISSTATRQVIDAEGYVERGYVNRFNVLRIKFNRFVWRQVIDAEGWVERGYEEEEEKRERRERER